ncbi:MAG: hypothetical protein LBU22_06445 [Dysgonamonadaceae bacterium]|nr:hypothetical protein [Dysgonamonadaceae bacterium]
MNRELVKVIVPVYKADLTGYEVLSLRQCCRVFAAYPIVIVKPESLDIRNLGEIYPQLEIASFDDDFFKNLASYNHLMLSSLFYKRFLDYEYILIYQLDAYVFRDELAFWCRKSYAYIGAPWIKKKSFCKNTTNTIKHWMGVKDKRPYSDAFYKVGNGGFSLRRVSLFYEIAEKEKDLIQTYLHPVPDHIAYMPEDIFWALEPHRKNYHFPVPDYKEGLLFSFDKYPKQCFQITKTLPFGCHGWNRRKNFSFWKKFI